MAKNLFGMEVNKNKNEVIDKVKKPTPIDFVKAICTKDKEEIKKLEPFINNTTYSQYMINNFLTQTISWKAKNGKWKSSQMWKFMKQINIMDITNRMHFDMLLNLVPKNHGFIKYNYRAFVDKDVDRIALKWKFNQKQSIIERYLRIISEEELTEIKEEMKQWNKTHSVKKKKK